MLGFYVPPTAKVIWRRDLGLKSHPKDWRSPGSNSGPLVYKAGSLTARPRRLLNVGCKGVYITRTCYHDVVPVDVQIPNLNTVFFLMTGLT